jgi:hypothetical protein
VHAERLWGIKDNRGHYSDIGVGEHFSRNAFFNFPSPLITLAALDDVIAFYEHGSVTVIYGDNPSNFFRQVAMTGSGAYAPDSVAYYPGHQFFLDEKLGVVILSRQQLSKQNEGVEPVSVSYDYINEAIFDHSEDELQAAQGFVKGDFYYLRVGDDVFKLNITASLESPRRFGSIVWIWSREEYPEEILPYCIGTFGKSLIFGSGTSGQVYEAHAEDVHTDDGEEIETIFEKRDWNPRSELTDNHFDSLHVIMDTTAASVNLVCYFSAGGGEYGIAGEQIELSIVNGLNPRDHEVKVPSNPGDPHGKKDYGQSLSFKIVEKGKVDVPAIERLELHYTPGIIT